MDLSRGAQRCIKLLRWYAARFRDVYPLQSTIAKHLGVTTRQVGRYVKELRDAGLMSVTSGGPHSACYQVVAEKNVRSMSDQCPIISAVSITESHELSSSTKQARKPQGVEIPPEYIQNQFGRMMVNPAFVKVRDAVIFARERIARAHDPEAYRQAIILKVLGA